MMNFVNMLMPDCSSRLQRSRGIAIALLALSFSSITSLTSSAQSKDLIEAMEAKKLVDETTAFELEKRAEIGKAIAEERLKAIQLLKVLEEKFKENGERSEAREIGKEIAKLEDLLAKGGHLAIKEKSVLESDIFLYGKEYLFASDSIKGRLTFLADGKVNAIFKHEGAPQNVVWSFEEKSDHILISDAGELGMIYISEVPQSEKRSIMIRLGGELRHHVVTGTQP